MRFDRGGVVRAGYLFNLLEVSAERSDVPKSPLAEERPLPPEPRLQKTTAADIVESADVEIVNPDQHILNSGCNGR